MATREHNTCRFPVMLAPSTRDELERQAIAQGVSVAAWVREAIRLRLEDERRPER
jgi:predicted HicB family RNase H-like nuclease